MPNSAGEEEVLPTEGRKKQKEERGRKRRRKKEIRLSVALEKQRSAISSAVQLVLSTTS